MRPEKKYHILYKTTNLLNGKFYVGVHSTNNLEDGYLGSGTYLRRSIRKYGPQNFKREILEFFDSRRTLLEKERELVNSEFIKEATCMNLHIGGLAAPDSNFGSKRTPETKAKMSAWIRPKSLGEKISAKLQGRKRTESSKRKQSASRSGIRPSQETKTKMSHSQRGKIRSEDTKMRMRKRKSDLHRQSMRRPKPRAACCSCGFEAASKTITLFHNANCMKDTILKLATAYQGNNFAKDHRKEYQTARTCGYLGEVKSCLSK